MVLMSENQYTITINDRTETFSEGDFVSVKNANHRRIVKIANSDSEPSNAYTECLDLPNDSRHIRYELTISDNMLSIHVSNYPIIIRQGEEITEIEIAKDRYHNCQYALDKDVEIYLNRSHKFDTPALVIENTTPTIIKEKTSIYRKLINTVKDKF